MKKTFMMLMVAVACSAQAASIQWNSGSLKNPTDASGTIGATGNIGNNAGYMTVWYFSSLLNAQDFAASGYTDGTKLFTSTVAGESPTTRDNAAVGGIYSGTTANIFAASTTFYTIAYVETTITGNAIPALNNTWYMYSDIGTLETPSTGNQSINYLSGQNVGGSNLWQSSWTPVPEPATAALALAGLAMLIRRRK